MNAAFFDDTEVAAACGVTPQGKSEEIRPGKHVGWAEFRQLAVSHRRMIRVDRHDVGLKGLHDLETGETFYTDAHRLLAR